MTLLIDADWLLYSSCCACEQDIKWDDNLHTLHADERDDGSLLLPHFRWFQHQDPLISLGRPYCWVLYWPFRRPMAFSDLQQPDDRDHDRF